MPAHRVSPSKSETRATDWNSRILTVGLALVVVAVLGAVMPRERGDNYCGTLRYSAVWTPPCGTASRQTAIIVGLLGSIGVTMILAVGHRSHGRRSTVLGIVGLGTVAAGLATANRLLTPADEAYCGSVLNRHRSSDPALEAACSAHLRPHAAMAAAFAAMTVVGGLTLWRMLQETRTLVDQHHASSATGRTDDMKDSSSSDSKPGPR